MLPILFAYLPFCVAFTGSSDDDAFSKYVELSMDLTGLLKDLPEFNEQEIHDLSKDCVAYENSHKQIMKAYQAYLANKSTDYQTFFTEKVIIPRHMEVVTHKLEKLPGFYLTKVEIEQFRATLLEKQLEGASIEDTIDALKKELAKDVGEQKAGKAIDMILKDLRILYKIHGKMIQHVDPALAYLIHEEL